MLYLGKRGPGPGTATPHPPWGEGSNWLKGVSPLRAYTAQRDHFLELHRRAGCARPGWPEAEGEGGTEPGERSRA